MPTANPASDPFDLGRFVAAQEGSYEIALSELKRGSKESHWMWFIFPQVAGLSSSPTARLYAIKSRQEATAYLDHPILGKRLGDCANALLGCEGKTAEEVMGFTDCHKLKSSMTLFSSISEPDSPFHAVLARFFSGDRDDRTIAFLADEAAQ